MAAYEWTLVLIRSTSMRTMSVLSSRAGTPKTGTLNSHDLSFSAQASLSGGSRSLNHSQPGGGCDPRPAVGNLQNRVPVSPLSQNKICHTFQGRAGGQMGHFDGFVGNHASLRANTLGNGNRGELDIAGWIYLFLDCTVSGPVVCLAHRYIFWYICSDIFEPDVSWDYIHFEVKIFLGHSTSKQHTFE